MSDRKQDARAVDELRQEVARLDVQLVALLDRRARACRQIGELRRAAPAASSPAIDATALAEALGKGTGDLPLPSLREILGQISASCLSLELPEPVAYVGGEGEAGHAAALARFGASATLLSAESPAEALEQIKRQRAAFAIVPLETREDGPVQATIEALTATELKIVAAFESPSNLQLLSLGGSAPDSLGKITKVYLTARDHVRCTKIIARLFDAATAANVVEVRTPLVACQLASEDPTTAAIAMSGLATQFGLEIAEKNVLDRGNERTRFAVVAPRPGARTGADATLIAFSVADSPGALFDVLRQFAEREINMTKIQSRPEGEGWMYTFFAEIVGHATDRNVVTALEEVKRHTKFFRVLGSYATA